MAESVKLDGMLKWCRPDKADKFGKFSTQLYLTPASLETFNAVKEKYKIKNNLNRDEDGDFIRCSTVTSKVMRGVTTHFRIEVLGPDTRPMQNVNIGNGSTGTVKMQIYPYKTPAGQQEYAWRWVALKVTNLVPFEGNSFTKDEAQAVKGIEQAQEPVW